MYLGTSSPSRLFHDLEIGGNIYLVDEPFLAIT